MNETKLYLQKFKLKVYKNLIYSIASFSLTHIKTIVFTGILIFIIPFMVMGQSKKIAEFSVHSGKIKRINSPVSVSLEGIPLNLSSGTLQLYEVTGAQEKPVHAQLEGDDDKVLRWILKGETAPGKVRNFVLKSQPKDNASASGENENVRINDDGKALNIRLGQKEVLSYRYAPKSPPEGVDEVYARGGYIHPLKSPEGATLTRIQPPDHYHHYGIWNPWTSTEFEGREIDFWNLAKEEGDVRPESNPQKISGPVFGGFESVLNHVDLKAPSGEKVALKEKWNVRVWNADPEQEIFLIDFTSTLNPATASPFTIKPYRYQGFSIRATEKWNDETATLLTSKGKNKSNGNGTRARWCDINGVTQAGNSGILFMTNPGNYDFPEQLRIWPTGMNDGEANVYFNFNPAQEKEWHLEPGNSYNLKYRMIVYDGQLDNETAWRYWRDFANPPKVEVRDLTVLEGKKVLVFTKNGEGYVHDNIPYSVDALKKLGRKNNFHVDATEDASLFTSDSLLSYDALIFSNSNNDVFNEAQRKGLQNYIRNGGGFVGIHIASGTERDWPWYSKMLGGQFLRHPPRQDFKVHVLDHTHPSTSFLPETWQIKMDECYYHIKMNPSNKVLLAADLTTVEDEEMEEYPGDTFGKTVPLAWYHTFDGGRQWYTALGHRPEHYSDPQFMRHVLGGIQWVLSDQIP